MWMLLAATALASPSAVLPAALPAPWTSFHGSGHQQGPAATATVYLGPYSSLAAASAAAGALSGAAPGYPILAHTDQLGLAEPGRGFVVVAGMFATTADAAAWQGSHLPSGTVGEILPALARYQRLDALYAERALTPIPSVVVFSIEQPGGVSALRASDVLSRWQKGERPVGEPLCHIAQGTAFHTEATALLWYDFAPVQCGDAAAYVPWRATTLTASVHPHADGYALVQVVGAEHDSPSYAGWRFGPEGRGALLFDEAPPQP